MEDEKLEYSLCGPVYFCIEYFLMFTLSMSMPFTFKYYTMIAFVSLQLCFPIINSWLIFLICVVVHVLILNSQTPGSSLNLNLNTAVYHFAFADHSRNHLTHSNAGRVFTKPTAQIPSWRYSWLFLSCFIYFHLEVGILFCWRMFFSSFLLGCVRNKYFKNLMSVGYPDI